AGEPPGGHRGSAAWQPGMAGGMAGRARTQAWGAARRPAEWGDRGALRVSGGAPSVGGYGGPCRGPPSPVGKSRGAPAPPGRLRARGTSYGFVKHFGELSRRLPQMLPRHRRQVIGLVVGDPAAPQHEDDLEPLR